VILEEVTMGDDSFGTDSGGPGDVGRGAERLFVGAYAKSRADWERWFIKTPRPSRKEILSGYCLGALEGAFLGFLQARWDGAVYGAFFGLNIGWITALCRWRIRKDIRGFRLALFLMALAEGIGILLIACIVRLPFFAIMLKSISGLQFVVVLFRSLAFAIPSVLLLGYLFLAGFRTSLRRSTLAGICGAVAGMAASVVLAVSVYFGEKEGVPGYTLVLVMIEAPFAGVFFGFIGGVALMGAIVRLSGLVTMIARYSQPGELDSASGEQQKGGAAVASSHTKGGVARSGLPEGQEPLPAWIPQRIQGMLWECWIQSHWYPFRVARRR
jgi:MFS family permease